MWGYWLQGRVVGSIPTRRPCHIALLYVDKKHHRRGIAKGLYKTALDYYMENSTVAEMTVNSSPYALEIYRRLGFVETDTQQTVNGICFIPMKFGF